jgi:hypothetical protein
MAEVIILSEVKVKLDKLIQLLVEKGYFGFLDTAEKYVHHIYDFIDTIPVQRRYPTAHRKYGAFYCKYKPNRNTTWFITFDTDNEIWVIRNIINNHTSDYPAFIRSI